MKPENSIRYRIIRVILLTTGSVLILTYASFIIYEIFSFREVTSRNLQITAHIIASNSTASLAFDDSNDSEEILSALRAEKNIDAACILRENGEVFAFYPDSLSANAFQTVKIRNGFEFKNSFLEGYVPIMQGGKRIGTLYLKRNLKDSNERLLLYSIIALVIVVLCFLLAYLLSSRLQRRISNPIIALSTTSTLVSRYRDYSIRATKQSDDEIGNLTDAFNEMLAQIEIQNREIYRSEEKLRKYADELELAVNERTLELRRQKEFAETVINSSLVLIAVFDTEMRFIGFNNRCEVEFGLPREAVIGKKLIEAMPGAIGTETELGLLKALQGQVFHSPLYRSGVSGKFYESFVTPLRDADNEIYAVLMTAHNITQTVESSEKLKRSNAELQKRNEELEQFAYIASHDLQEPLRKIQTFVDLARTRTDNPEAAAQYLKKVEFSAARMSALIKDVLEYSRLSRIEESFIDTNLNDIINHIRSDFELVIQEKNAQIITDNLPTIRANKLQIHQLFANLISNAMKFSEREPIVRITWQSVKLNTPLSLHSDTDNFNKIVVSDNGIGFDEQFADQVFTIFQRLNTREKYPGTGIGLALSKKIVENHGGKISVRSVPGQGTTFEILLPVQQ